MIRSGTNCPPTCHRRPDRPEIGGGLVCIVCAAAGRDAFGARWTADDPGPHVMELEERTLATSGLRALERALALVTQPDGALHVGRDVARARLQIGRASCRERADASAVDEAPKN